MIDLDALWDFGEPAISEERFREALTNASGGHLLIGIETDPLAPVLRTSDERRTVH